jgi:hypothetical protein
MFTDGSNAITELGITVGCHCSILKNEIIHVITHHSRLSLLQTKKNVFLVKITQDHNLARSSNFLKPLTCNTEL